MLEQLDDVLLGFRLHLDEDLFRALFGEIAEQVGGGVGIHFLDDFGGAARIERLQDGFLNLGFDLFQRFSCHVLIERLKDCLTLIGSEIFDDVGDIGGMQLCESIVRDFQLHPASRIGFDHIDKIPWNSVGRNLAEECV